LDPGLNLLVWANNVGKTALVHALSGRMSARPHRSPETAPGAEDPAPDTQVDIVAHYAGGQIFDLLRIRSDFAVPISRDEQQDSSRSFGVLHRIADVGGDVHCPWGQPGRVLELPAHASDVAASIHVAVHNPHRPRGLHLDPAAIIHDGSPDGALGRILNNDFARRRYAFDAERLNIGVSNVGANTDLATNAANLPEVVNALQANHDRYMRFVEHVRTVFPEITHITVPPLQGNALVIKVWDIPTEMERSDLAVPLSECGTGIGQVVAMLYVVVTATTP
jgi:hypothetical protein